MAVPAENRAIANERNAEMRIQRWEGLAHSFLGFDAETARGATVAEATGEATSCEVVVRALRLFFLPISTQPT